MRTLQYLIAAAFLLSLAAISSAGAQGVVGSAHDLSAVGEQVCIYCHTPHNADVTTPLAEAPLWNRTITSTTFTMYDSPTIDMTIATDPQGVSLACLSCHDGVTAYNSIIRGVATNIGVMAGLRAVGADGLGNDHPISITYDTTVTGDTAFVAANPDGTIGPSSELPLYGTLQDQVECATCHNPHVTTNGSFLRISNNASAMCLTCHVK